jgi:PAS domain S-box-containing protein
MAVPEAQPLVPMVEMADPQALLAAIVDSSDDAIVSKTLNGIVTSWNPAAERMFGYAAHEMIGSPILRLIPPDRHDEEKMIISKIRANQRIDHYETTRLRKGGLPVHVSVTISPLKNAAGVVIGASKIARDVTWQRELDRASAVLAAIVQSSDDAIISKDLQGKVTSWNPAAERLYGYGADEMIGAAIHRVIPAELVSEEELILSKIRAGERIDHYETTRLSKSGRRIPVSISVSPIRDFSGRIVGASKIARDMTAQHEARRQKDLFLAVLAHELRNPLAPIRNAIMILKHGGLSPEQRDRALTMAERQTVQMSRLLDDLLDVSRIATGKVELKRARVELGDLANHAVEAVAPLIEARGHTLTGDVATEPMWLDADPVRIVQILTNLLTNAAKYTDPGGKIDLSVRKQGDEAVIRISDTGVGFSPEMQPRLFTLFSQAENAVTRAAGGLGIGLALVREFVERHGGSVEAASPGPNLGSTFTVRLPLLD